MNDNDFEEAKANEAERQLAFLNGNEEARVTGELSTLVDWATLLADPLTTIAMTQWARIPDAGGFYMAECMWSFEVDTPEGRKLDASGQFFAGVLNDGDDGEDLWR